MRVPAQGVKREAQALTANEEANEPGSKRVKPLTRQDGSLQNDNIHRVFCLGDCLIAVYMGPYVGEALAGGSCQSSQNGPAPQEEARTQCSTVRSRPLENGNKQSMAKLMMDCNFSRVPYLKQCMYYRFATQVYTCPNDLHVAAAHT